LRSYVSRLRGLLGESGSRIGGGAAYSLEFKNGTCRTQANGLPLVQLGTAVVGVKNNGGYSEFQLEAETKDNTSVSAHSGSLNLSALLGKSSGKNIIAFSGHSTSSNVSFSGSVNCHGVIRKM
jgi:hypothetical protein